MVDLRFRLKIFIVFLAIIIALGTLGFRFIEDLSLVEIALADLIERFALRDTLEVERDEEHAGVAVVVGAVDARVHEGMRRDGSI